MSNDGGIKDGENGTDVHVQRRGSDRVAVQLGVTMTSETNFYVGFAGNISSGGVFVATHQMVPVGNTVELQFRIPGDDKPIEVEAKVCWQRTAVDYDSGILPGFGVQFIDLDDDSRERIERFIDEREPIFHPE